MLNLFSILNNSCLAGHIFSTGVKAGIAKEKSSGLVLKVVDGDDRGKREVDFYTRVFSCDDFVQLRNFIPRFCGCRVINNRTFMRLEHVSLSGDNVMDVKIGSITWDHLASLDKIKSESSKFPFGIQLGFRILGFRVTDQNGKRHQLEKTEAKSLRPQDISKNLGFFLSPDSDESVLIRRKNNFLEKLNEIKDYMDTQTYFRFISSSILLSYDVVKVGEDRIEVKMIDFAHTHPSSCLENYSEGQVDQNYIQGFDCFINYFSKANVTL